MRAIQHVNPKPATLPLSSLRITQLTVLLLQYPAHPHLLLIVHKLSWFRRAYGDGQRY
jgi:hypothetical protein